MRIGFDRSFDYENGFYLTAGVGRFSKIVTHLDFFRRTSGIAGDIVECGVFKGASFSRWVKFRALLENPYSRKIIGFDTFGKYPAAKYRPDKMKRRRFLKEAGPRSISKTDLIAILEKLNLYENIELVEGDILKTVNGYLKRNPDLKISLLNIDVDLYEPTRTALEKFYPHVAKGGIILLDDYGAFPGANKAADDFFAKRKTAIRKLPFSHSISYVEK